MTTSVEIQSFILLSLKLLETSRWVLLFNACVSKCSCLQYWEAETELPVLYKLLLT